MNAMNSCSACSPRIPGIDEEQDAARAGVFEQAVDLGDGREGLARPGRHLDEGAESVCLE
jgi:hypothetical protein